MRVTEWLLLLILSCLWGGAFFFNKIALQDLQPLTLVLGRVSCAAIGLLLYVRMRGEHMPATFQQWRDFWIMGLLNNLLPFCLIVWAQQHIDSGLAAILNATTPLFTVVLAHFLTHDEHLTLNRLSGVLLGFAGVVVLVGTDLLQQQNLSSLGQFAVLGAGFSYACAGIYGRRFQKTPASVAATAMLISTACTMLPIALIIERPWQFHPQTDTWFALIGLGFLCTAIAYCIYFHILSVAGATNLLLVTFLIPISALLLGNLFLREQLSSTAFAGMGLISLGLAAIDGRLFNFRSSFPRR